MRYTIMRCTTLFSYRQVEFISHQVRRFLFNDQMLFMSVSANYQDIKEIGLQSLLLADLLKR